MSLLPETLRRHSGMRDAHQPRRDHKIGQAEQHRNAIFNRINTCNIP